VKIFLPILDNGGGSVKTAYMESVLQAFGSGGYNVFIKRASDSHPNRGMNKITADFLESDCDEMLVIDGDIVFGRQQIDFLFEHDLPLVYGAYPKRQREMALCLCTLDGFVPDPAAKLIEVRRAGRGFMRVHRKVFENMRALPGSTVAGNVFARFYENHGRPEWSFWDSGVVGGSMSQLDDGAPEWLSEDWLFCERARALGYRIMVDQRIHLGHVGDIQFPV
jgi:hypothetical protein